MWRIVNSIVDIIDLESIVFINCSDTSYCSGYSCSLTYIPRRIGRSCLEGIGR